MPAIRMAALRLPALALAGILLCAVSLRAAPASATSFNPQFAASLTNPAPAANSDLTLEFGLPAPDANFEGIVTFLPPEFTVTPGPAVTDGALAGAVTAASTLGLINGPCNTPLPVEFHMMDASTDPAQPIDLYSGVDDFNGNGLPENVEYYPSFLNRLAPDTTPVRRLYGQTQVAGLWVPLNFVVFQPGTPLPLLPPLDPALGYPTVVFLLDPTAMPMPSPVTDFCSPLATTTVLNGVSLDNPATEASEAGQPLQANPEAPGTYYAGIAARSRWDADNDGIENTLDSCPLSPDAGDPRIAFSGDTDGDGLFASCDPNDDPSTGGTNSDADADGFVNRQDNCALVANEIQVDQDRDMTGDACDPYPGDPSNGGASHRHQMCALVPLGVGAGGAQLPPSCPAGPDIPLPPRFDVYPEEAARAAGTVHTVSVQVIEPMTGSPIPAVPVEFSIQGANPGHGSCLTSEFGYCQHNFLGQDLGTDTVVVSAEAGGVAVERTVTVEWVIPPANDAFANAEPLADPPSATSGTTAGASTELGEPEGCGAQGAVWYRYQPGSDRFVRIRLEGSAPVVLNAYLGQTQLGLTFLGCAFPGEYTFGGPIGPGDYATSYYLPVQAGSTYYFRAAHPMSHLMRADFELTVTDDIQGDSDCSTVMDPVDVLVVLSSYAGLGVPGCWGASDYDCSGSTGMDDLVLQLKILSGLFTPPTDCYRPFGPVPLRAQQ